MKIFRPIAFSALLLAVMGQSVRAEVECKGWSDVRGFRYQGELMEFNTNLRLIAPGAAQTAQPNGQSRVQGQRVGNRQTFSGMLAFGAAGGGAGGGGAGRGGRGGAGGAGANFRVQIEDTAPDTATFDITASSNATISLQGLSYVFNLPGADFGGGSAELIGVGGGAPNKVALGNLPQGATKIADATVQSVRLAGKNRQMEITFAHPTAIVLEEARGNGGGRGGRGGGGGGGGGAAGITLSFPVGTGDLTPNAPFHISFTLKASCDPDVTPVKVTIDASKPGPAFFGMGGNFRLQGGQDPAHIAYNLENLRVAWARVAMPLDQWQTSENADPIKDADAGNLNRNVRQAMELARTLAQKKIPMIISDWSAPNWAVDPNGGGAGGGGGGGGARRIADDKWPAMYKGIASYLTYLKKNYGAEPLLFSFNEADQGINVKLTPDDQRVLFRELGAYLAAQGLGTKMLLGDTGNPTPKPANYIDAAVNDPEAMKWVGAVSYHSWTGGSDQVLAGWGQVAQRFHVPLLIAEGGTDPASYNFRHLFLEPWYAVDEMNLYLRCARFSQPASILHWQLTENYSILTGGQGGQPLQPTQRFYNLKQMNLTPPEAPSLALAIDHAKVTAAAYGDAAHGYAIHLINTGATRKVTLAGLPVALKQLAVCVTDAKRNMKALDPVHVTNGTAEVALDLQSYMTLTAGPLVSGAGTSGGPAGAAR